MHRIHNIYMIQGQKMKCEYYKDLLKCLDKNQVNEVSKVNEVSQLNQINHIHHMIQHYCYNSFSNKSICASVNTCGVTLK
jgi:hypothetical protein